MDDRRSSQEILLAPAAHGGALRLPGRDMYPRLDEHVVRPEVTREEVVRGRRVIAQPAREGHGDRHCELDYVVRALVNPGYVGSTDLLTRHSEKSDFATDTCVRKAGIDPETGERYLEELAFEVVHEQSLKDITERAEEVIARGVRRMIAIFVKKGEVREWSAARGVWVSLDLDGVLRDPCLMKPLRVRALLDAAEADNEVARAILAKRPPAVVEHEAKLRAEERREGKRAALLKVVKHAGLSLSAEELSRIDACTDLPTLDRWFEQALSAKTAADLFR